MATGPVTITYIATHQFACATPTAPRGPSCPPFRTFVAALEPPAMPMLSEFLQQVLLSHARYGCFLQFAVQIECARCHGQGGYCSSFTSNSAPLGIPTVPRFDGAVFASPLLMAAAGVRLSAAPPSWRAVPPSSQVTLCANLL